MAAASNYFDFQEFSSGDFASALAETLAAESLTRIYPDDSTSKGQGFGHDEKRIERISLLEEGSQRKIRMANLAIVGSHVIKGVAAIHSELLRTITVQELERTVS